MTDLAHLAELLHAVAHRERLALPALRDWLRGQCEERAGAPERSRRIDSDAAAVQILTVWGAKGLQFPVVYLPFAFNRHVFIEDIPLYHDDAGVRCLDFGGPGSARSPPHRGVQPRRGGTQRHPADICRADAGAIAGGGLVGTLQGRTQWRAIAIAAGSARGQADVPDSCVPKTMSDDAALACFREWEAAGGPVIEESSVAQVPAAPAGAANASWTFGTFTARSTPPGGAPRIRR